MKKIVVRLIGMYLNLLAWVAPRAAGRKGFYLFCIPQRVSVKQHQQTFLGAAENFSFESEGTVLRAYRWGNGPKKILFLHGWQSHTFRWKNYVESFPTEEYSLYAFDAPAHGQSGGKYLNLPLYSKAIESFFEVVSPVHTVVSHSLGSLAMLYSLFRFPELPVRQLAITGIPGEVSEFLTFYQQILGLSNRVMKAIYQVFDELIQHQPEYFSAVRFAQAITIPLLIIHDEHDDETPYHHARRIHEVVKGSRLITTSGLGHNLRSVQVVKHINDFVGQAVSDEKTAELLGR